MEPLDATLLHKRLAQRPRHSSIRGLYGNKAWVDDLDIVNELGGHTGCVNALSWSRSGRLLASGSDDTHLNIWAYNPESLAKPFTLNSCVSTGHVANIFSVKFMPHSNDQTVVTCAGDSEVRVFDIERGGASGHASGEARAASTRSRRFQRFFSTAKFLNDGNTNCRVYRSHADRVKRIVTESSPHLFLTCSEDGEVRQWDLRQPSSFYPAPRGGQGFMSYRHGDEHDANNVPPPLISYKNYSLDLNTISCSPRQPHYIALGGAHLHCFLHDRRMLGRNLEAEQGKPPSMTPEPETRDDELMGQATRCVKRFAPNGKPQMSPDDNGHITACKISDSNPNEMIASWSGDHIYSFDLVQSSDAREAEAVKLKAYQEVPANRVRRKDRKRKRQANSGTSLGEPARARMAVRGGDEDDEGELSLRVRYGNGQTQNIPLNPPSGGNAGDVVEQTRESLLSQSQKLSDRVAKALVKLRKTLFDFRTTVGQFATQNTELFTSSLGQAATLLPQMHEIMRDWRFPMDPTRGEVAFQQTLRRNRQSTYRFVQACGTLSRVLGGRLQTLDPDNDSRLLRFQRIVPAPLERDEVDASEHFAYDFLRAILLWFEGGRPALLEGFKKPPGQSRFTKRYPLDRQDEDDAIEKTLIPYLAELSSPKAIVDIDASRFEVDENRIVFSSQSHAVQSFSRAVRGYDLGWTEERGIGPDGPLQPLDRAPACRFWGVKVGRSLLMTAGEGVNYEFVNRAFGGIDINIRDRESFDPMDTERVQEEIDLNEFDEEAEAVDLIRRQPVVGDADDSLPEINMQGTTNGSEGGEQHGDGLSGSHAAVMETIDDITPSERDDVNGIAADHISGPQAAQNQNASIEDVIAEEGENRNNERAGTDTDSDEDDDVDAFESDSDDDDTAQRVVFRSSIGFGRSRQRARVESDKPCSTHTRIYKGHCNVKTVKDINFYGLDDEYIISGSDDGNFFIWDRKTTRLLNILEGDGEIVNVIQGHPYEPMIAASGIDNTVKIFSPDARMQDEARKGNNIANPGGIPESSLGLGNRRTSATSPESTTTAGLTSRRRVDQMYQIISSNDVSRQGGVGDAYLTRSMLARIAASINRGQGGLGQGGQIVIDDNCTVM